MTAPARPARLARVPDRVLNAAEIVVYAAAGVVLAAAAALVLVNIVYHVGESIDDGVLPAVTEALDGLLLVFILLELLAGVRATMLEHKLVAEPFLVVGVIASIKEIVVVALEAKDAESAKFDDAMVEIGVLGVLILLLAISLYLVRLKEREPEEGDESATA